MDNHAVPTIGQQPQDIFVRVGENATLECDVISGTDLTYQWQKALGSDSNQMSGSGSGGLAMDLYSNLPGENMSSLAFTPVNFGDEGDYRCTVTNPSGTTESDPAIVTGGWVK